MAESSTITREGFSFPQPQRGRLYEVLRRLGEAAIRTQKITEHGGALAAQNECLRAIEALVTEVLAADGSTEQGAPVQWGDPKTVAGLIAQLRTLPPDAPIYGTFHGPDFPGDGRRTTGVRGVTLSRERVKGRWLSRDLDAEWQHIIWTKPAPPDSEPAEPHRCFACCEPFKEGDRVSEDANEGTIHADCCGPERESYVGADGEPLKPGEPIPEPGVYRSAPRAAGSTQTAFRAGDVVRHRPSGETWTVAYADPVSNNLAWCGWPDGIARVTDCEMVQAATDEQHLGTVRAVITGGGTRAAAAQRLYGNPDQDAQEAAHG